MFRLLALVAIMTLVTIVGMVLDGIESTQDAAQARAIDNPR